MKKLIPFDLDAARSGAKVVTETGLPVEIIPTPDRNIGNYILCKYYPNGQDKEPVYDIWPSSGVFDDPVGNAPELRIEIEELVKNPDHYGLFYEEHKDNEFIGVDYSRDHMDKLKKSFDQERENYANLLRTDNEERDKVINDRNQISDDLKIAREERDRYAYQVKSLQEVAHEKSKYYKDLEEELDILRARIGGVASNAIRDLTEERDKLAMKNIEYHSRIAEAERERDQALDMLNRIKRSYKAAVQQRAHLAGLIKSLSEPVNAPKD